MSVFEAKQCEKWIDWLDKNTINNLELKAFITSVLTELARSNKVTITVDSNFNISVEDDQYINMS